MKIRRIEGAVLALILALGGLPSQAQDLLYAAGSEAPPIWVSASKALQGVGVDWDLFDPEDRDDIELYLDQLATMPTDSSNPDDCALRVSYAIVTPSPDAPDRSSLEGLVAGYRDTFVGHVEAVTPGFYQGILGNLVRLRREPTLAGDPPTVPVVNAFIEAGTMTLRGRNVCKPGARGQLPKPGSRLLFFYNQRPLSQRDDPVIFLEDETVFYTTQAGVSLSRLMASQLPEDYQLSFDDLLAKAARLRVQAQEPSLRHLDLLSQGAQPVGILDLAGRVLDLGDLLGHDFQRIEFSRLDDALLDVLRTLTLDRPLRPVKTFPVAFRQRLGATYEPWARVHTEDELQVLVVPAVEVSGSREVGITAQTDPTESRRVHGPADRPIHSTTRAVTGKP